jgi:hypothetical protein
MNFLKNKLLTPFRRADMANSPFHRGINMEEKRSTLFADRRRIPGRKAKVLLTVMFCFQMVGMKKLVETKKFMKLLN